MRLHPEGRRLVGEPLSANGGNPAYEMAAETRSVAGHEFLFVRLWSHKDQRFATTAWSGARLLAGPAFGTYKATLSQLDSELEELAGLFS